MSRGEEVGGPSTEPLDMTESDTGRAGSDDRIDRVEARHINRRAPQLSGRAPA